MPARTWLARLAALACSVAISGCAARGFVPPEPGQAVGAAPDASAQQWRVVSERCQAQQRIAAEGALSGRVSGSRVRGRLHLGLTREGGVRLEAIAPFGAPIFVLAGRAGEATLLLPRETRSYQGDPADVIEALAGIRLDPAELFAVANGCLGADRPPERMVLYPRGLVGVSLQGGVELWLQGPESAPRVIALRRGDLLVDYPEQMSAFPIALRLRRGGESGGVDLRLRLSQVERNGEMDDAAFRVEVPPGTGTLTLDELRRSGLFGTR